MRVCVCERERGREGGRERESVCVCVCVPVCCEGTGEGKELSRKFFKSKGYFDVEKQHPEGQCRVAETVVYAHTRGKCSVDAGISVI